MPSFLMSDHLPTAVFQPRDYDYTMYAGHTYSGDPISINANFKKALTSWCNFNPDSGAGDNHVDALNFFGE